MQKIATLLISILFLVGCGGKIENNRKTIFVTITPLQSLIDEITMGDFDVEVIVPKGASPETFEPTPKQVTSFSDAEFIFSTGLIDFEQSLIKRIDGKAELVNLSKDIELIAGSCSCGNHHHKHGIDPHIWTSPRELRTMVGNMHRAVVSLYPDSTKYNDAAERIIARLDSLDSYCQTHLSDGRKRAIMIYHPAYTYLAHNYNIEQIAIENEGKEPTAKHLIELVERGREMGITTIFHQPQYSASKLRSIADELNAEIVVTDPLSFDIEAEIRRVVDLIAKDNE